MTAAGHWFDALAYIGELERDLGARARLPTIDEYLLAEHAGGCAAPIATC